MLTFDLEAEHVTDVFVHSQGNRHTDFIDKVHVLDKHYYFTTDDDALLVFPKVQPRNILYGLGVRYIRISDRAPISIPDQSITLTYHENNFTVLLETCYFGQDSELYYAYKLHGTDPWIEIGQSPSLNFTNLNPGNYMLNARVSTRDGQSGTLRAPLMIRIQPPWWQTWWFRIPALLCVALSAGLYYRKRITGLKEKHAIETKLIRLEQVALKSQMNPHFLFNCLNGIRTLISMNEREQAVDYVNHLSRLLRDTLQHYEDVSVSLQQELAMTENYLALAKLRFGDKITWQVSIAQNIDPGKIQVPPFILQPLVENAIWHGIKHLETDGSIELVIEREGNQTCIRVLDNGVGLHKAAEVQQSELRTRKHIGLSLVRTRLEAIGGRLVIREREGTTGVASIIYLNLQDHV
jgi:signal transduction histidine kinase